MHTATRLPVLLSKCIVLAECSQLSRACGSEATFQIVEKPSLRVGIAEFRDFSALIQ